jgi:hypothetical protein
MRAITWIGVVALVAGATAPAAAQTTGTVITPAADEPASRVGTRGANFLLIGVGARGQAMANAYTGLATGATAMYWNPAGLGATSGIDVAFTRTALYEGLDITHTFAGIVLPVLGGGLGLSFIQFDSGDIPRTTEDRPDGGDPLVGLAFSWQSTSMGLHYGRRLTDRLAVGVGAKLITEGMNDAQTKWWALDVGTQFNTGLYGLQIGAALTNIGPSASPGGTLLERRINDTNVFPFAVPMQFRTTAANLPTAFHFSLISQLLGTSEALLSTTPGQSLRAVLEFADGVDTDLQTALAAEYSYRNTVFLRAGKRWFGETNTDFRTGSHGLSVGGGLRLPVLGRHLTFDYAHTSFTDLGAVQVFSFELGGN